MKVSGRDYLFLIEILFGKYLMIDHVKTDEEGLWVCAGDFFFLFFN